LLQVSLLAAIGGLNTASINPAYGKLGKELGVSKITASYQTTTAIVVNGIGPWLWIPFANKYGRRPIYLGTTLLGFGSILACAYTKTFGQLIAARVFNGFFPVAFALGAATVVVLFFYHQRGRAMGFCTITMTSGSHLAPIVGGLIGQYLGWRWIFKIAAIIDAVMFVTAFFFLPETLYIRNSDIVHRAQHDGRGTTIVSAEAPVQPKLTWKTYLARLKLISHHPELKLRANQFVIPSLKMARYPSVIFPALYYSTMYGFASILPAVTVASIFEEFFRWDTLVIGLAYGGALSIGGVLGEFSAGWVVDLIVRRERALLGRDPEPEVRLKGMWLGEFCVPAGLLIYGFTLQYHAMWFAPIFGMGLACFGLQIITTTTYTYAIDCYRVEGSEVSEGSRAQFYIMCRVSY
jgi:MFS family permease